MPKYTVVTDFKDLQDNKKLYKKGDRYPKPVNKKISKERLEELSTKNNAKNTIFISETEEQE